MFGERRLLTGGIISALAVTWILVALGMPNGLPDLLIFLGPAALLAIAVAWLFFTFAGDLFTWSRAARSVIVGVAALTPILGYFFSGSKDQNLMSKFLFMVAVGWAASLGGTLWSLAGAASDAFSEWRAARRMNRPAQGIRAGAVNSAMRIRSHGHSIGSAMGHLRSERPLEGEARSSVEVAKVFPMS